MDSRTEIKSPPRGLEIEEIEAIVEQFRRGAELAM